MERGGQGKGIWGGCRKGGRGGGDWEEADLAIDAVAESRGGGLAGVGVGDFAAHAGAGGHGEGLQMDKWTFE